MFQIFDWLQILLWTAVYITVVFNGIKYRQERPLIMPYLPGALNFAWEVNAFSVSGGMPGHILWLGLDTIILILNIRNIRECQRRIFYLLGIGALIFGLSYIFSIPESDGMLISAFIIDLIMALVFVLRIRAISTRGKKTIAVLKLFGDGFASLAYFDRSLIAAGAGICVFLLNLFYLAACFDETGRNKRR